MGLFGGPHLDGNDCIGAVTAVNALPNLPDFINPGFFFLLELGACWQLEYLMTIYFCGLHFHAGQPPTYPDNMADQVPKDAARLVLVNYPPEAIYGESITALAASPLHDVITMGPEMTQVK